MAINIMRNYLTLIFENEDSKAKIYFDLFINIIIIISIYTIIQEHIYQSDRQIYIWANDIFFYAFSIEYGLRFWMSTQFTRDYRGAGLSYAITRKIQWALKVNNIIDLLALAPDIRYLRLFRIFRLLRLVRVARLFRSVYVQATVERAFMILRSFRQNTMLFLILFAVTFIALMVISLFIFAAETAENSKFITFTDTLLYSFQLIKVVENTPATGWGKAGSTLILLINMAFLGMIISLMTTTVEEIMEKMKKGKIGKVNFKNHIVLCGYTKSTETVIKELLSGVEKKPRIVLISRLDNPDITGVIYMNGDFTKIDVLKKANIDFAKMVIVFTEKLENETSEVVDMRTMLTVFNVEKEVPGVHTVAEINETDNGDVIREKIQGDELIYKETLDGNLIASCVRHPYISSMIYDLLDVGGKGVSEILANQLLSLEIKTIKDIKLYAVENNKTLLGFIDENKLSTINPDNEYVCKGSERLIFIE